MATFTRQPFAELGTSRLQALQSAKNKQNGIPPTISSSMKPTTTSSMKSTTTSSTGKRQRSPHVYEDGDSENIDPSVVTSPSKKPKLGDAGLIKPAKFALFTAPLPPTAVELSPPVPSLCTAVSSPGSSKSTPISKSRGSPKHSRIHAISKRRASSSPFRRIDPPTSQRSPSLPFSIDAALSGTIQGYTPKPVMALTPVSAPVQRVSIREDSMPKAWFFEIHQDTPEQEAANLMEHSAAVLDISSEDDLDTKTRNEELERGKENIPPPGFLPKQARAQAPATAEANLLAQEPIKRPRLRTLVQDAMDEDRRPLGDLQPSEFYGDGCDASTHVTVDAGIEKPSSLSKQCEFDCPSPEKKLANTAPVEAEPALATTLTEQAPVADLLTVGAPVVDDTIEAVFVATAPSDEAVPITASS